MSTIRVTYDEPSDKAYLYLDDRTPRIIDESRICEELGDPTATILDIDPAGRVIGIEMFNASRRLPELLLSEAESEPPPSD